MKKFLQFTWLPIVSGVVIIAIYGGSAFAQNQQQNRTLESKIDELSRKIGQLDSKINQQGQIAGVFSPNSQEDKKSSSKLAGPKLSTTFSSQPTVSQTAESQATPTPAPNALEQTPEVTPTPVPTANSATPVPTPTATLTPTSTAQKLATVEIQGLSSYQVNVEENDTALSVLLRASQENNFSVDYQNYEGLGAFVNCIAGTCSHDNYYWALYYNGQYSMVGASSQPVIAGDITAWKFETW